MDYSSIFTNLEFPTTKKQEAKYSLMLKDKVVMEMLGEQVTVVNTGVYVLWIYLRSLE